MARIATLRQVFPEERKSNWLMLRVTPTEKASIRAAAAGVHRNMSAYLLALHTYAVGRNGGRA